MYRLPAVLYLLIAALIGSCRVESDDSLYMNSLRTSLKVPQWSSATHYCQWNGVNCDSASRVTAVNLKSRNLSGAIPDGINKLTFLQSVSLQQNSISGTLPSFSGLSNLQKLYLDNNFFAAVSSSFLRGLTSLQEFSISENPQLQPWQIPYDDLADSASLAKFYGSNANIYGPVPDMFDAFPSLQELRLSYNNLTGPLPPSVARSGIGYLWLNNQKLGLSGSIEVLAKMSLLSQAWIHVNDFNGPVPDLSNCTQLFDLQLRDNQLTGVLPSSIFNLPKLTNVSLHNNKLQGPYPAFSTKIKSDIGDTNSFCLDTPGVPCDPQVTILLEIAGALGYPLILAESWRGNDVCDGWSFVSCDQNTKKIVSVTFGKQGFTGTISPSFSKLESLKTLLLNDNNLHGTIPSSLTKLSQLKTLDVSNNDLIGPVPPFSSNVTLKTTGNPKIQSGDTAITNPSSTSGSNTNVSRDHIPKGLVAGLMLCAIIFVAIGLFISYKNYTKNRKENNHGTNEVDENRISTSSIEIQVFEGGNVFYPIDLLRRVTDDFDEQNVLGKGGFGVVYKGVLQDGTIIAVKRMEGDKSSNKGLNEFKAEIGVLTKVRHRHLVALLGFCITETERLLVYEYMTRGTLAQRLFEFKELGFPALSWKQRMVIALDVARGVEYLHSLARESFIHRDLKPSNVLLDDGMRAKVADFGLVKIAPDGKYSLETKLAGTFGYLAPEYAATGRVTTKVDVYAYGVMLMEIITGRKSLDEKETEDKAHLVPWFRKSLLTNQHDISILTDKTIDLDNDETHTTITQVAELAGHCTARESYQRPDMSHVVSVLCPLVEQWKPIEQNSDGYVNDPPMSLPQVLEEWLCDEVCTSIDHGIDSGTTRSRVGEYSGTFLMEGR